MIWVVAFLREELCAYLKHHMAFSLPSLIVKAAMTRGSSYSERGREKLGGCRKGGALVIIMMIHLIILLLIILSIINKTFVLLLFLHQSIHHFTLFLFFFFFFT